MINLIDELMDMFEDKAMGYVLFRSLQREWSQINTNTKLVKACDFEVKIARDPEYTFSPPKSVLVNKHGLNARVFRAIGELVGSKNLIRKGKEVEYDVPEPRSVHVDTVQLKHYVAGAHSIWVGYYAPHDVLFYMKLTQ